MPRRASCGSTPLKHCYSYYNRFHGCAWRCRSWFFIRKIVQNWRFLKVFNGSYIILHSDDWLFTLFGGVSHFQYHFVIRHLRKYPRRLDFSCHSRVRKPCFHRDSGAGDLIFRHDHFFLGRTDHWIFGGTLAVFFFGTMKGCSLLIECEAILADLFLREGKYQWCGPTKVIKPRCTCLIGLIWGITIPKTMRDHNPDIGRYLLPELSFQVSLSQHFQTKSVHIRSPFYITSPPNKWVCLKIGYIPNYSHFNRDNDH